MCRYLNGWWFFFFVWVVFCLIGFWFFSLFFPWKRLSVFIFISAFKPVETAAFLSLQTLFSRVKCDSFWKTTRISLPGVHLSSCCSLFAGCLLQAEVRGTCCCKAGLLACFQAPAVQGIGDQVCCRQEVSGWEMLLLSASGGEKKSQYPFQHLFTVKTNKQTNKAPQQIWKINPKGTINLIQTSWLTLTVDYVYLGCKNINSWYQLKANAIWSGGPL